MACVTPLNTRIFAGHLVFGEFRAILRGVVVKKIHIFLRKEITVIYVIFLTCTDEKLTIFLPTLYIFFFERNANFALQSLDSDVEK
jgi:hypothetical protein